jgi:hypothetical protein
MAEVTGVGGRPSPPEGSGQTGAAGGARISPDLTAGLAARQRAAAERLRESGGASAVEALLRLDREPPILGAFPVPRGNREALRRLNPAERRRIMHVMLKRQRARLAGLLSILNDEGGGEELARDSAEEEGPGAPPSGRGARARRELDAAERMLRLLAHLLDMQDHTLSQMGSFQT